MAEAAENFRRTRVAYKVADDRSWALKEELAGLERDMDLLHRAHADARIELERSIMET